MYTFVDAKNYFVTHLSNPILFYTFAVLDIYIIFILTIVLLPYHLKRLSGNRGIG